MKETDMFFETGLKYKEKISIKKIKKTRQICRVFGCYSPKISLKRIFSFRRRKEGLNN
jgi:hypothetical protein